MGITVLPITKHDSPAIPHHCRLDQRRVGWRGHVPQGVSRGGAEKGCGNFLRHEIYKNSVSSVEAGMGMEGQIVCVEQCTF